MTQFLCLSQSNQVRPHKVNLCFVSLLESLLESLFGVSFGVSFGVFLESPLESLLETYSHISKEARLVSA